MRLGDPARHRRLECLLVLLVATTACSAPGGHPAPTGNPAPRSPVGTATATAGSPSVRVVYRVEDSSRPPARVTTQVLDLSAPYAARLVTRDGPPPGAASLGGLAWDGGAQYLIEPGGVVREISQLAPGFAGVDAHLDVALPVAVQGGLVAALGPDRVAGTACRQWLSQGPLDGGGMAPATPTDRAVSCVDAAGRILRDRWTVHGTLVRVRTAVSIGAGPSLDGSGLLAGAAPSPAPSALVTQQFRAVPLPELAGALGIAVPAGPAGLPLDRSVALIDVDPATGSARALREGGAVSWTDGHRLVVLVIKRGLLQPVPRPSGGFPLAVAGPATGTSVPARLRPILSGLALQWLTPRGLLVTVTGDLPAAALLSWARTLRLP